MSLPVYDSWDIACKAPFGAVRRGQSCRFTIRRPACGSCSEPVLVMFRPGFKERFLPLKQTGSEDGAALYTVTYTPGDLGVHYYYFTLLMDGERRYIKRQGASVGGFDHGELFQLTVYREDFRTPSFVKGGVMYQIFPDRFARSGEPHPVPEARVLRDDWGGIPEHLPDEHGKIRNNDFFGGDLRGIEERLPYLASLGVTCIYLNPVFEAHENHRYNTADYRNIDPLLGTNKDFERLCRVALSDHGIRIVLDGVFNHTGADSLYFNKYGRYGDEGAYRSKDSPYYPWYTFHRYPDEYESWWGIDTLPNVNELDTSYANFMCGEEGVLRYWLSLGASGWRLDVADELPDAFLDRLHATVKAASEENLIIGEVWEDATTKESYGQRRRYLIGEQLDSVMNYPFKDAILEYIKEPDALRFRDRIMTVLENYPKPSVDTLMNSLSTHDTERAITRLAGDSGDGAPREWLAAHHLSPEQRAFGGKLLQCAMVLQFFLPGVPCVYYGDEAGMEGYRDPFNRGCFPWDAADQEMTAFVRELAAIRASSPVFREGTFSLLHADGGLLIFSRRDDSMHISATIFLNRTGEERRLPLMEITDGNPPSFSFPRATRGKDGQCLVLAPYDYAVVFGARGNEQEVVKP